MSFEFKVGQPACPVACKYCHVTELDADRTANWSKGLIGINKACTFMNVPPWIVEDPQTQKRFLETPWDLFKGDFVGWTAVTDGFMPSLRPYFWNWVEQVSPIAKLVTVVTKWPVNRDLMKELSPIPNLFLVITITGNPPPIEAIPVKAHLRTLALAKEYKVRCLPMCHPYISGISDLSFLSELKSLGYDRLSIKGLRYNPDTMGAWMPDTSKPLYEGQGIAEILPEDGWKDETISAGLTLQSPRQWYELEGSLLSPHLELTEAARNVDRLLTLCQIASSADFHSVKQSAIVRRL